ncbi:arylesterase [Vibrio renipiscarius]|uniref:Acyl-CoA thioesterase n=1 Tax=Vibrio renipiscarius TaxID=1461322 RepID=A0A0C2NHR0_9VIBR|nr:arylesterase [Vibrio renipiscarius]KII75982.1 acyl-CoA thioesterase [Vibrio renipiscarius]KII79086.1 acyl-CoA thioesterase [Vibrio renipiscarius]
MIRLLSLLLAIMAITPAGATTLLVLGDSLSAGYQMPIEKAWPSLLPNVMKQNDQPLTIVNGSVSGDTTGNGLARLPELLSQHQPTYVLIELGANDGLRGFPPALVASNLTTMIDTIKAAQATPILMQIHVLPNYGKRYTQAFSDVYPKVASEHNVPLVPFFLESILRDNPQWIMNDGLHPKEEAQPWIAEFVSEQLINHL